MKKVIISAGILGSIFSATKVQAQQGIGTITPDKSSILHLESSKRGLLIPNVSIPNLDQASPVDSPAKSLLVYNTNDTTGQGFYYWDGNKWVRFTSSVNQPTVTLADGENTTVDSTQSGNNTEYKVNVAAANGTTLGVVKEADTNPEVLVNNGVLSLDKSQINLAGDVTGPLNATVVGSIQGTDVEPLNAGNLTGENGKVLTYNSTDNKWEPATPSIEATNVSNAANLTAGDTSIEVIGGNGATLVNANVKVKDGGISTDKLADNAVTTVKINDGAVNTDKLADNAVTTVKINDGAVNTDKLADDAVTTDKVASGGSDKVMVTDNAGNVQWITKSDLVTANQTTTTVSAVGPLDVVTSTTGNATNYQVKVTPGADGQVLVTNGTNVEWQNAAATVTADNGLTKANDNIQLGGNLVKPTTITTNTTNTLAVDGLIAPTAGNTMVVEQNGVLRKLAQSLKDNVNGTAYDVASIAGYNTYVPQIFITAELTTADINLKLPVATDAEGQIINIKLLNTTDTGHYLNINNSDGTPLTYGGVPYQGWILKSDGTSWRIVGSN